MANPNATRNMINGVYHKHLFKDERRVEEQIVRARDGKIASSGSKHNDLTASLGDALTNAVKNKNSK